MKILNFFRGSTHVSLKPLFASIVAAACCLTGWSASYDMLTVSLADNSTVKIIMTDNLHLSFEGNDLIATGSGADVRISKADIRSIAHGKTNHVGDVVADSEFEFNNGLIFHNLPAGSHIVVCDLSGKVEVSAVAEGEFSMPIDGFMPGTHILSVNGKSYKIFIK